MPGRTPFSADLGTNARYIKSLSKTNFPLCKREAAKKLPFIRHPGENRVQRIVKASKILDSGFRRNDRKKTEPDFFTASGGERGFFKQSEGKSPMSPFFKGDVIRIAYL